MLRSRVPAIVVTAIGTSLAFQMGEWSLFQSSAGMHLLGYALAIVLGVGIALGSAPSNASKPEAI